MACLDPGISFKMIEWGQITCLVRGKIECGIDTIPSHINISPQKNKNKVQ